MTSWAVAALLAIKLHEFAASGCAGFGAGKGLEPVQHEWISWWGWWALTLCLKNLWSHALIQVLNLILLNL
jgi:hypothetical protein